MKLKFVFILSLITTVVFAQSKKKQIELLTHQVDSLQSVISEQSEMILNQNEKIDQVTGSLETKITELSRIENLHSENLKTVEALNQQIEVLNSRIAKLYHHIEVNRQENKSSSVYKNIAVKYFESTVDIFRSELDTNQLLDLIHPEYGLAYITTPSYYPYVTIMDKSTFSTLEAFMSEDCWYYLFQRNRNDRIKIVNELPDRDCEYGFYESGIFHIPDSTTNFISDLLSEQAYALDEEVDRSTYRKYDFPCRIISERGGMEGTDYCFAMIDGKWYLVALYRFDICSA